ncbi:MAG: type II secretion system protein N [Alphaproteobacteria bacterium]|jgi:Bacterial type II secretion system protein N.|nr:type II secretion system protein N [Alphaproteobacteria bacterium]MBU0794918.1 type II secretion system protein N [Alphaproteobacteria bacterium]MBU0875937.1 type II secretion system protein N [Alphaproteobacteria bacterium]MBU1770853.1 type II secretion system protein N [Alphaproteobacteria bacterium]
MMAMFRTTRARIMLVVIFLIALLVTWPLRAAFNIFGLKDMGVAARSLRGPIWWGGAEELQIRGVQLGTVDVFLSPVQLLVGRVRIDIIRRLGDRDDITGAFTLGFNRRGVDDVTGSVALGAPLAPLPVSRVEFEDMTVHFSGDMCTRAEGRVRARVPAIFSGLGLANGLAGDVRCAGDAVELPLVSQSGQEQLSVRLKQDGSYEATMRVRTSDPLLGVALGANGFQNVNGEQVLRTVGRL